MLELVTDPQEFTESALRKCVFVGIGILMLIPIFAMLAAPPERIGVGLVTETLSVCLAVVISLLAFLACQLQTREARRFRRMIGATFAVTAVLQLLQKLGWFHPLAAQSCLIVGLVFSMLSAGKLQSRTDFLTKFILVAITLMLFSGIGKVAQVGEVVSGVACVLGFSIMLLALLLELKRTGTQMKSRLESLDHQVMTLGRTNESLEVFVRSASHDLKAPLRHIATFNRFVLDDAADRLLDREKEDLERGIDSADHMTNLLNSLLTFAKLGTHSLEREPFSLQEVVEAILLQLPEEQRDFVTIGEMSMVTADRNLILLVMQNLIENALKFDETGLPDVLIQCSSSALEVQVSVVDHGIGMARGQFERIFQPGVRGVTDCEFRGTGYGLASCVRIVEAHDGKIWVESEEGKGSAFHFTLPR
ncbi:MAG: ATP-binding protein [Rubripirellula sp.]